jgi:hypothetical protein
MRVRLPKLSPSTAISTVALAVALAGPAHAAVSAVLADGSVGTAALMDGAVTTPKLHEAAVTTRKLSDGAATSRKIQDGAVRLADLAPTARPKLPTMVGTMNAGGLDVWPEWVTVLRTTLPPGTWHVMAKGVMLAREAEITCDVVSGPSNILDRRWALGPTADPAATPR